SGFYAGQRFHKVVRTPRPFIAQVGDPNSIKLAPDDPLLGSTGTGIRIPYEETHHTHDEGAVSLATLGTDKDSGDCQFFFVLGAAHFLDGHYTVFGKVVAGLDVMRALQRGDHVQTATILKG
ncbi:MAG: peptidylprolyl isomerase, partial [Fimbriimonas ginsengisoli]|nr:peptidylprolyl isomerase [Fimbriimonas ginsengisoli]